MITDTHRWPPPSADLILVTPAHHRELGVGTSPGCVPAAAGSPRVRGRA